MSILCEWVVYANSSKGKSLLIHGDGPRAVIDHAGVGVPP